MAEVTVGELLRASDIAGAFQVTAGAAALERHVRSPSIQRLGVALTGHTEHLDRHRIQLIGRSECGYLRSLEPPERMALLSRIVSTRFPCLVVTSGQEPSPELLELSAVHRFVLVTTELESPQAAENLNSWLHTRLAPSESVHGVLLDVYGVGVLLLGKSGVGKSEVGLELIAAGHRLVADDRVLVHRSRPGVVMGTSTELTRHHMEIRGLGILNIRDLFGSAAVRERKRVELVIELVEWDPDEEYDRLGLDTQTRALAGVPVPYSRIPIRPGRTMKLIVEVAARNRLLHVQGTHSARNFAERLSAQIARASEGGAEDDE